MSQLCPSYNYLFFVEIGTFGHLILMSLLVQIGGHVFIILVCFDLKWAS